MEHNEVAFSLKYFFSHFVLQQFKILTSIKLETFNSKAVAIYGVFFLHLRVPKLYKLQFVSTIV